MKRRMVYPDVLRAISCIAVVVLSVSMAAGVSALTGLLTWAAPLFVMLSGMFFLDSSWYINPKELVQRYILRLLLSYVIWWIAAEVVNGMTGGVLSGLLTGDRQYLNFLIVMLALYAFSPILRVFTRSAQPRELRYMVIFGLVVCSLYPFMNLQAGFTRPLYYALLGIGYLCVYAAGWYFRSSLMTRRQLRVIYLLGGICLILSLRGIWTGTTLFTSDPTMMIVAPDAILIAAALFLVVKNTLSGMRLSGRVLKPIAALARLSFGIYLIHPILLAVICYALNTFGIVLPTGAFVLLTSIVLIVVSALITWLLKKIPKVGAYIV